jgi:poly(A) polymerase
VRADVTTANPARERAIQGRIDELEERIAILSEKEELARLRAPIDGHEVMEYLGLEPGPLVGEIMQRLLDRRIDDGPYSSSDAYREVREWALGRGMDDPGPPPESEEE